MSGGGISSKYLGIYLLFATLGVLVGIVIKYIMKLMRLPLPYSVILFHVGIVCGVIASSIENVSADYEDISYSTSKIILYGFLPTLVFHQTMKTNWHHFSQTFYQSILLAVPGSILVWLLFAVLAKFILPFHWSWIYSLIFGAVLCATDHIGIASLLKNCSARAVLTMTLSSESLLNDGATMLLFAILFDELSEDNPSPTKTFIVCLEKIFVSPLIGLSIGFITARIMSRFKRPKRDYIELQLLFTIGAAYLTFFISEGLLHVSGALACCCAGFMISLHAPIQILHDHKFHFVWDKLEWICNTLTFLVAGFVGGKISSSQVTARNIGYVLVMYCLLMLLRAVTVFSAFPVINQFGVRYTWQEGIFMTCIGVRGGLAIAFGLEAAEKVNADHDEHTGKEMFFMVTALASMTMLLNGSTASYLLVKLKLVHDPRGPISPILHRVITRIQVFVGKYLRTNIEESLRGELGDYDKKELMRLCTVLQERPTAEEEERGSADSAKIHDEHTSDAERGLDLDLLKYIRTAFLHIIRARYHECIESGKIGNSSYATKLLLHSNDMAQDDVSESLTDWACIISCLQPNPWQVMLYTMVDNLFYICHLMPGCAGRYHASYERIAMYVLMNYIDAHEYAQERIHFFLGGEEMVTNEQRMVVEESRILVERAKTVLGTYNITDVKALYTYRAAQVIVEQQIALMHEIIDEGVLTREQASHLLHALHRDELLISKEKNSHDKSLLKENIRRNIEQEKVVRGKRGSIFGAMPVRQQSTASASNRNSSSAQLSNSFSEQSNSIHDLSAAKQSLSRMSTSSHQDSQEMTMMDSYLANQVTARFQTFSVRLTESRNEISDNGRIELGALSSNKSNQNKNDGSIGEVQNPMTTTDI